MSSERRLIEIKKPSQRPVWFGEPVRRVPLENPVSLMFRLIAAREIARGIRIFGYISPGLTKVIEEQICFPPAELANNLDIHAQCLADRHHINVAFRAGELSGEEVRLKYPHARTS